MPKVSVIVTIYNAGEFLYRCLDSLLNQTLRDIEIILVIDCPTDGSDIVAKDYASRDLRIKIVENRENLHIGESRNVGIRNASGRFITFIDHDDFCSCTMLEKLYNQAINSKSELVWSILANYDERSKEIKNVSCPNIFEDNIKEQIINTILMVGTDQKIYRSFNQCHGVLYDRYLLEKFNISFCDTRIALPEDVVFNLFVLCYSQNVSFIKETLYFHSYTTSNTASSISYYEWDKWVINFRKVKELLCNTHRYEYSKELFNIYLVRYCNMLFAEYLKHCDVKQYLYALHCVRREDWMKLAFKTYVDKSLKSKYKYLSYLSRLIILF